MAMNPAAMAKMLQIPDDVMTKVLTFLPPDPADPADMWLLAKAELAKNPAAQFPCFRRSRLPQPLSVGCIIRRGPKMRIVK
jgi:hypothetical protein